RVVVAELLAVLLLLRGVLRPADDRQTGVVAIVLGLPVPESPGGDRRDRTGTDIPHRPQRGTACLVPGVEVAVELAQPIEGVGARRCIILQRRARRELAGLRPLGRT